MRPSLRPRPRCRRFAFACTHQFSLFICLCYAMRCEWIDFIVLCVTINSAWKATHALRLILIGCNVVSDVVGATHMKCVLILFELHICTRRKFLLFSRSWAINVVFVFFFLHLKYNFYSLFFFCFAWFSQKWRILVELVAARTHTHKEYRWNH